MAKILPLRPVQVSLRPITKHSLAFSCDGDLAVAGDDAVQIFAPEFPKLPPPTHAGFIDEADLDDGGEWDDDALGRGTDSQPPQRQPATLHNLGLETRSQYSGASRTIPVSKKPLDPRVNSGLYAAAGEPFPAHTWTKTELQVTQDRDGHRDGLEELFYDVEDEDDEDVVVEDGVRNDNRSAFLGYTPLGSGIGPITGVGGSMNQFVSMAWSPNGLGTNRRPVLAVLTNTGVITVFGDGEEMAALARDAKSEYVQPRNLESWEVLWGVGERVTIPGQETEAEYIRSFAWAEDVGPRQAILGYLTDDKEMVLVSVQTSQDIEADENNGCKARGEDFRGRFVWQVREVARFTATGPHPDGHITDLDWTPSATSYGLVWSPWLLGADGSRSCLVAFIDRHYVGFREVNIGPWNRGEVPGVQIADHDIHGICTHLANDAFVKFEGMVWSHGETRVYRGFLATPMELKPFELSIPRSAKLQIDTHSPNECGSTYPSSRLDPAAFNPIMDIVIHPPNPLNLSSTPHYTLIRLSATSSNTNWLETKHALASSTDDQMPQWALNLSHLLEVKVPQRVNLLQRGTGFDDDEDSAGSVSGDEYDDPDLDDDDEDELGLEPKDGADELEVYPHRFRLWAMAASSGGGVTAVLVTRHNTQRPERQAWHVLRSMVYFEHQSRSRRRRSETQTGDWSSPAERSLSTEGRMFEWMYGQGPGVPTLTMPAAGADLAGAGVDDDDGQATARREIIRVLIEAQQCEVCGAAVQPSQDTTGLTVCTNGHRFGPCGSTGLAVQQPGIARTCGVCGMRTIRVQELVRKMPERRAEILRVGQDLCGRCGGKFLN